MQQEPTLMAQRDAVAGWLGVDAAALSCLDRSVILALRTRQQEATAISLERDLVTHLRDEIARLRDETIRDPMTRALNRRGLDEQLHIAAQMCAQEQPIALFLIDVDGLKTANDTLGHAAGDALIAAVAERLGRGIRASDALARIGGDEFVLLCPGVNEAAATALASKLKQSVEAEPVPTGAGGLLAQISIGYAVARTVEDATHIVEYADQALYSVKHRREDRPQRGLDPIEA